MTTASHQTQATRGRPRDPSRDRAILAAARDVIAERGYTGATMDDIAKRAKVGKDTLYRRWPSKESLAIDVIDALASDAVRPKPIDPDPRFNLLLFLKDIVRLNRTTDFGQLVAGIVGESSRNPDLAACSHAFWARRRELAAGLVRDIVGGVADEALAVHLDRILAPIYYRLLLTGDEITDEYLWDLVVQLPSDPGHVMPSPPAVTSNGANPDPGRNPS